MNGHSYATPFADFDQSYDPINGLNVQGTSSSYTVSDGDTLQSIAAAVWGDGSLWYLIADANGLNSASTLISGQSLSIPNKVTNLHNDSKTFRVYDPNQALGDLNPGAPKPPKAHGCGIVGQILMVAIAVAVTALLRLPVAGFITGWLSGAGAASAGAFLGGAVAAAAGSVASQAFGVATGIQSKFSWKSVATTVLTAGLAPPGTGNIAIDAFSAAVTNAGVQGFAVATGLQKKFDWVGVAAAAIGSATGNLVGGRLHAGALTRGNLSVHNILANFGAAGASAFANASTRSLISGTSFGDNLIAALPDVIGGTLGNVIAGRVSGSGSGAAVAAGVEQGAQAGGVGALLSSGESAQTAQTVRNIIADGAPGLGIESPHDYLDARPLAWLNPILDGLTDADAVAFALGEAQEGDIVVTGPSRRRSQPYHATIQSTDADSPNLYFRTPIPNETPLPDAPLPPSWEIRQMLDSPPTSRFAGTDRLARVLQIMGQGVRRAGPIATVVMAFTPEELGGGRYEYGLWGYSDTLVGYGDGVGMSLMRNGTQVGSLAWAEVDGEPLTNVYILADMEGHVYENFQGPQGTANAVGIYTDPITNIKIGVGISVQSPREAQIANMGFAERWDSTRINAEILLERSRSRGWGDFSISDLQSPARVEANAARRLAELEAASQAAGVDAHFVSRHGAGTTIEQQRERATNGLTPDGAEGRPQDSSRFYSNHLQLQAATRAQRIYGATGQNAFTFEMMVPAGEGVLRGGMGPALPASRVTAVFRSGHLYTLFPQLR